MPEYYYKFDDELSLLFEPNNFLTIKKSNDKIQFPLIQIGRSFLFEETPAGLSENVFKGDSCGNKQFYLYLKQEEYIVIKVGYNWNHDMGMGTDIAEFSIDTSGGANLYETLIGIGRAVRDGTEYPQSFLNDVYGNIAPQGNPNAPNNNQDPQAGGRRRKSRMSRKMNKTRKVRRSKKN
jgi:hypothetical protein